MVNICVAMQKSVGGAQQRALISVPGAVISAWGVLGVKKHVCNSVSSKAYYQTIDQLLAKSVCGVVVATWPFFDWFEQQVWVSRWLVGWVSRAWDLRSLHSLSAFRKRCSATTTCGCHTMT